MIDWCMDRRLRCMGTDFEDSGDHWRWWCQRSQSDLCWSRSWPWIPKRHEAHIVNTDEAKQLLSADNGKVKLVIVKIPHKHGTERSAKGMWTYLSWKYGKTGRHQSSDDRRNRYLLLKWWGYQGDPMHLLKKALMFLPAIAECPGKGIGAFTDTLK